MIWHPGMAVTGVGVVSPTGQSKKEFFRYLREPALDHGARPAPGQLLKHLNLTEPKLKMARYVDPVSKNAIVALGAAMADAGIEDGDVALSPHSYGIVLGTIRGACETRKALYASYAAKQRKLVSGTVFSHCGYNIAGAMAAIAFGIKGPNLTIAGRGDVGLSLLKAAQQLMISQRAHTIFVGFTECDARLAKTDSVFSELAYVLCLERKDRAAERDAFVLAEVNLQEMGGKEAIPGDEAIAGFQSPHEPFGDATERLPLPLPGLKAVEPHYASLVKLGLLAHDPSIRERFPEIAFTAWAGKLKTAVRLQYAREDVYAL